MLQNMISCRQLFISAVKVYNKPKHPEMFICNNLEHLRKRPTNPPLHTQSSFLCYSFGIMYLNLNIMRCEMIKSDKMKTSGKIQQFMVHLKPYRIMHKTLVNTEYARYAMASRSRYSASKGLL